MSAPGKFGFLLIAASVVGGCGSELVETTNRYSTYDEAKKDGAMQRGWLPQRLPTDAHGIIETHKIDSNESWVRFQYGQTGVNDLLRQCVRSANPQLPPAKRTTSLAPWWPKWLMEGGGEQRPVMVQAFHCSNVLHAGIQLEATLILAPDEAMAWYWIIR